MKFYYDIKCKDLAKAFLEDEPKLNNEANAAWLATAIQEAIEDWMEDQLQNLEWKQIQAARAAQSIIEAKEQS